MLLPKLKVLLLHHRLLERGENTNIQALAQIITVGVFVIVIPMVVIMIAELRRGSSLLPLAKRRPGPKLIPLWDAMYSV